MESFERIATPQSAFRTTILALLMSLPSYAKAELPDCHDIGSRPDSTESVRLEDGDKAEIVCIVDGDTFDARISDGRIVRIRLWGVDCPESFENSKCMGKGAKACEAEIPKGKKAKELTRRLLAGKKITLHGPFANIKHRKQAYVEVRGSDLGMTLIGSCQCAEGYKHKRKQEYKKKVAECR